MLTTFDVFVDVLQDLGVLNITTTTGASSKIALVDSKIAATYEDDEFNEGWAFCIRTSDGLAPQGEYVRISDYDGVTGTFTVDTFSANVDAGDTIGFINDEYPLRLMLERLNSALRTEKIGDLVLVDTSITTVSGQTEYTLPLALKRRPFRVEIQTSTTSGDYEYVQIYGWRHVPAAAGSTGKLVLSANPDAGKILRVWYRGQHPTLSTYSSVIDETIPPEIVRYALLVEMMSWLNSREEGENDHVKEEWNKYESLLKEALNRWDRPFSQRNIRGIELIIE